MNIQQIRLEHAFVEGWRLIKHFYNEDTELHFSVFSMFEDAGGVGESKLVIRHDKEIQQGAVVYGALAMIIGLFDTLTPNFNFE